MHEYLDIHGYLLCALGWIAIGFVVQIISFWLLGALSVVRSLKNLSCLMSVLSHHGELSLLPLCLLLLTLLLTLLLLESLETTESFDFNSPVLIPVACSVGSVMRLCLWP